MRVSSMQFGRKKCRRLLHRRVHVVLPENPRRQLVFRQWHEFQLGGKRIMDPVRSVHCLPHRECFDLRTYFEYHGKRVLLNGHAKNPLKICPVCKQTALEDDLRIDEYITPFGTC